MRQKFQHFMNKLNGIKPEYSLIKNVLTLLMIMQKRVLLSLMYLQIVSPKLSVSFISVEVENDVFSYFTGATLPGQVITLNFKGKDHVLIKKSKSEAYSEPCQTSKRERFAKIVNGIHSLTVFAKCSILDVSLGSECASVSSCIFQLIMWDPASLQG